MLHPLFSTLIQRPDLLVDHLSAYGELLHKEASCAGAELLARLWTSLVAVLAWFVFLGLAGTALMLGVLQNQFHWILVAVPGALLVVSVIATRMALKPLRRERFPELKAQISHDAQALRTVA